MIGVATKDKLIKVLDPRQNSIAIEIPSHEGSRAAKLEWTSDQHVFTCGFAKNAFREMALWDIRSS